MWGCTRRFRSIYDNPLILPTHVGVYHDEGKHWKRGKDSPHACGGVPRSGIHRSPIFLFSPRMWGCTIYITILKDLSNILPTHVGVYHIDVMNLSLHLYSPHACGGVPTARSNLKCLRKFSPRMWGCTWDGPAFSKPTRILPTHVGVYHPT